MDAWWTTALGTEQCLGSDDDDHLHIFGADVVESFGTVDMHLLDCVLGRLGLRGWFRLSIL